MKHDPRFTKPKKGEDVEDWMTTFADMVTLLLAFFVMLVAISKVDPVLFEQVKAGLAEGIGQRDVEQPINQMKQDLQETINSMEVSEVVSLGQDNQGLTLEFASGAFYGPGSAEIREPAKPILRRVVGTLSAPRYENFQIEVQGHTDDVPINTPQFPSNWDLSAARATGVVRFFQEAGIRPDRMKAIGFADVAPKVPNRDPNGNPIAVNQEINRRITVRLMPR